MSRIPAHGYYMWHELMSTDPAAATAFYTKVIGWNAKVMPMERASGEAPDEYTLLLQGDSQMAGLMKLPPTAAANGAPSNWLGYVGVTDVAETVAQATQLGATLIVPPMPVPGIGTFAVFNDPWGATFAILQPTSPEQPIPQRPIVGDFSWNEVFTDDVEKAISFYHDLFGWKVLDKASMGDMGDYHLLGIGDFQFVGLMKRIPSMMPVCAWVSYIAVTDIQATVKAIAAEGGKVNYEPHQVPGGSWISPVQDPQGAHFAVQQMPTV